MNDEIAIPSNLGIATELIRTTAIDGQTRYNLLDWCSVLGIKNNRDVIERLSPNGVTKSDTVTATRGTQSMTYINEGSPERGFCWLGTPVARP